MQIRSVLRTVIINIAVLIGLILSVLFITSLAGDVYNLAKSAFPKQDKRAALPVYTDHEYAGQIFRDQKGRIQDYVPYVEWRHAPLESRTLNVDGNGRRTHSIGRDNAPNAVTIGFFGGSTVWGTGVDDNGTIPAQFDAITQRYEVTNYGERGYTTLQNLIDLMTLVNQGKAPEIVVFYGGAADIWVHCNDTITSRPNSHMGEGRIRAAIEQSVKENYVMNNIVRPIISLVAGAISGRDEYRGACGQLPARAERVAETLVKNLEMMQQIVSGYGGEFMAFYQPTAFSGKARLDHLDTQAPEMKALGKEYNAVDGLVRSKIAARGHAWLVDLGAALDGDDHLLIDYAHLGPKGNEVIAQRISAAIN